MRKSKSLPEKTMRLLLNASVVGSGAVMKALLEIGAFPRACVAPVGLKRRVPDMDRWSYESPWFAMREDRLEEEMMDFLGSVRSIVSAFDAIPDQPEFPLLTLCPVRENATDEFSCLLGVATLNRMASLGLGFQVAPASLMPHCPYWLADGVP